MHFCNWNQQGLNKICQHSHQKSFLAQFKSTSTNFSNCCELYSCFICDYFTSCCFHSFPCQLWLSDYNFMSVIMRVSATRCGSFTVIGGHQWKFQLLWLWKSRVTSWDETLRTTYIVKKIGQCAILENLHYHPKPFSYFLIFAFKFTENLLHRKLATYWRWPFWNIALQKWYDAL